MNWSNLAEELKRQVTGRVIACAPMREYTTWRIGGPADILCSPRTEDDVIIALSFAEEYGLPVTVIGNGSNLLVRDEGIRGLTLRIEGGLNSVQVEENRVLAGAGILLPSLSRIALRAGLSGLEFAAGIPASLGGAVVMNAGAFGQCLGDLVLEADVLEFNGNRRLLTRTDFSFNYRTSSLQDQKLIILRTVLQLTPEDTSAIAERMENNLASRIRTQPLKLPTAGSVFRNPPGHFAAKLIELAGLKGVRVGDAQVSPKHANFIVNLGNASAHQVITLIEMIKERVRSQFGIELVSEVCLMGEEG